MLKGLAKIESPDRQQAVKNQRPKRKNQGTVPRHPPMYHHKKQSPPDHCPGGQSEQVPPPRPKRLSALGFCP